MKAVIIPTLAMLMVLAICSMAVLAVSVLAPVAADEIGVDPSAIGLFTAVVYVVAMFTGTVSGNFVARFGAIRVCQFCLVAAATGMALLAMATPTFAILSALTLGLAYGPLNPASADFLTRLGTPRWRPLIFSAKQTGVPVGGALAGALVPVLVMAWDWRIATFVISTTAILFAMLLNPIRWKFSHAPATKPNFGRLSVMRPLRLAFSQPELRKMAVIAFSYAGCQVSVGAFYVVFLVRELGWSLVEAGGAFAFVQIGGVVGRIIWGALSDQSELTRHSWQAPRTILSSLGLLTATMLLITALLKADTGFGVVAFLALALGASSFGWNGVFVSEAANLAPQGAASDVTAGVQFVMFGGVVVLPPLFSAVVAMTDSYRVGFSGAAVIALLAACTLLRSRGKNTGTPRR